jgi:hypothetical protein
VRYFLQAIRINDVGFKEEKAIYDILNVGSDNLALHLLAGNGGNKSGLII